MKKLLTKFAGNLLSKQQMKTVKGGIEYCRCTDDTLVFTPVPDGTDCKQFCAARGSECYGYC